MATLRGDRLQRAEEHLADFHFARAQSWSELVESSPVFVPVTVSLTVKRMCR